METQRRKLSPTLFSDLIQTPKNYRISDKTIDDLQFVLSASLEPNQVLGIIEEEINFQEENYQLWLLSQRQSELRPARNKKQQLRHTFTNFSLLLRNRRPNEYERYKILFSFSQIFAKRGQLADFFDSFIVIHTIDPQNLKDEKLETQIALISLLSQFCPSTVQELIHYLLDQQSDKSSNLE